MIWPSEVLAAQGHAVHVVLPGERDRMMQGKMRGDKMIDIGIPADADVIVLQRVTHRYLVQAIPLIRRRRVAVVVDVDDDLTCIHPANPAFALLHPNNGDRDHSWQNTLAAAEAATLVTVSTPALVRRYGRRDNAEVLYNMVPARMLDVPRNDSDVIGWAGSVHSHPTDLQAMGPAPAQLIQVGYRWKIAGPVAGVHAALGVPETTEIESTGTIHDIYHWPLAVASLGIGVAPLADTRFNSAKSWLKMAEYAAAGVPCVASPRAEYVRINKLGVGWIAKTPNDWKTKLRTLADSADARAELSERGRFVMAEHTIEANAWRWMELWQRALARERSTPLQRVHA
jgi:hypothetical protein